VTPSQNPLPRPLNGGHHDPIAGDRQEPHALDDDGKPDFPQICECVLMRRTTTPLTFVAFEVLSVEGRTVMGLPYSERRPILNDLGLHDRFWRAPEAFDDGAALWEAVCEHELEGVIAKKRSERYLSGERGWVKTKNRGYWC
jgi:bifunctional non-homologous end joining protein LigD